MNIHFVAYDSNGSPMSAVEAERGSIIHKPRVRSDMDDLKVMFGILTLPISLLARAFRRIRQG